jgi:hypothetical protein
MMHQVGFEANHTKSNRRSTAAMFVLAALAILFNMAYLGGDFYLDDFLLLNGFDQGSDEFSRWQGVWGVDSPRVFERLWWKSDDFNISFWRPIPSLIWEGSLALFGANPLPLHLFFILVHAGVVVGLFALVRRLTGNIGLAFLAGLFFVGCEDHAMPLSWISANTDTIGTLFMVLALVAHAGWLKERKPGSRFATFLFVLLALGCKESAVVLPLVLLLMTWLMPRGSDEASGGLGKGRKSLRDWLPEAVTLVVYLGLYLIQGFGAVGSLGYLDPIAAPSAYLAHLVLHLPAFWMAAFSILPPSMIFFIPELLPVAAVIGVVLFAVVLTALWPVRRQGLIIWSIATFLIALAPQLSTDASERGLYFPMIAGAIVMAVLASNIGPLTRRIDSAVRIGSRWTRVVGWFFVVTVLLPGLLISATRPWVMNEAMAKPEIEIRTALPHIERSQPDHTIILNTSGFMTTFYCHDVLDYRSQQAVDVWPLSAAQGVFSLQKTGGSSFVVRTDRKGWLSNAFARILRSEPLFEPGQSVRTRLFAAGLEELTADRTDVLAVRFDFDRPLNDPAYLFLYWNGQIFEPVGFDSMEIGAVIDLADTSDLAKAMNL